MYSDKRDDNVSSGRPPADQPKRTDQEESTQTEPDGPNLTKEDEEILVERMRKLGYIE